MSADRLILDIREGQAHSAKLRSSEQLLKKRSVTPEHRAVYDRHHSAIVAAVRGRNAEQAAEAMREHLRCVNANLFEAVV